jgi:hypothetical protein
MYGVLVFTTTRNFLLLLHLIRAVGQRSRLIILAVNEDAFGFFQEILLKNIKVQQRSADKYIIPLNGSRDHSPILFVVFVMMLF